MEPILILGSLNDTNSSSLNNESKILFYSTSVSVLTEIDSSLKRFLGVLACIFNLILFIMFALKKKLMASEILICANALLEFLICIVVLVKTELSNFLINFFSQKLLCTFEYFPYTFLTTMSFLLVITISFNRYVAVKMSWKYQTWFSVSHVVRWLVAMTSFVLIHSSPEVLICFELSDWLSEFYPRYWLMSRVFLVSVCWASLYAVYKGISNYFAHSFLAPLYNPKILHSRESYKPAANSADKQENAINAGMAADTKLKMEDVTKNGSSNGATKAEANEQISTRVVVDFPLEQREETIIDKKFRANSHENFASEDELTVDKSVRARQKLSINLPIEHSSKCISDPFELVTNRKRKMSTVERKAALSRVCSEYRSSQNTSQISINVIEDPEKESENGIDSRCKKLSEISVGQFSVYSAMSINEEYCMTHGSTNDILLDSNKSEAVYESCEKVNLKKGKSKESDSAQPNGEKRASRLSKHQAKIKKALKRKKSRNQKHKVTFSLFIVCLLYVVIVLPQLILQVVNYFSSSEVISPQVVLQIYAMTETVYLLNFVINPLLYFFCSSYLCKQFKQIRTFIMSKCCNKAASGQAIVNEPHEEC